MWAGGGQAWALLLQSLGNSGIQRLVSKTMSPPPPLTSPFFPPLDEGESAAGTHPLLPGESSRLGGDGAFSGLLLSGEYKAHLGGLETKLRGLGLLLFLINNQHLPCLPWCGGRRRFSKPSGVGTCVLRPIIALTRASEVYRNIGMSGACLHCGASRDSEA